MAESIKNVDPLNWDIKIRRGLTFHNGEPINADAVVFTFDRAKKLHAAGKGDLTFALGALKYDRMEKVDDYTVRIVMSQPDPIITAHMVNPELSILPPKYYSENPPEKVVFAPVGAGGYRFVSYRAGEGVVLKAFDKYRLGKPPVEDVVVKAVPEVATRISELKAGSADLIMGVPADLKQSLEGDFRREGGRRVELPAAVHRHQAGPPSGARRRARPAGDEPRDQLRGDRQPRCVGGMAKCRIDLVNAPYNNPEPQAVRLRSRRRRRSSSTRPAGCVGSDGVRAKDGVRLALDFDTTNGSYIMDKEIAQVAADSWKEVGIEIKDLRVIDNAINAQMRARQGAGYRDLMNSSSGPDYTCQGDLLLVQKDSGSNRMSWVDEKFEAMFKAFTQEFDPSKWQKMCYEAEAYAAEQAPVIWLFPEPTLYGVSERLAFTARPDGRLYLNLVLKGVK